MTIGVGPEGQDDLAAQMSAQEDRLVAGLSSSMTVASPSLSISTGIDPSDGANYAGGSSYSPDMPLAPSSAGLAGLMGANAGVTHPGVLKQIRKARKYLKKQEGTPYPNVLNQKRIAAGYLAPTDTSFKNNMNKGWNAAAQPGAAPGLLEGGPAGFANIHVGALSWEQAMNYSPAPLTDNLGALRSAGDLMGRDQAAPGLGEGEDNTMLVAGTMVAGGVALWWSRREGYIEAQTAKRLETAAVAGFLLWMFTR